MQVDTMFGIPVFVLNEEGIELPESGNYYVVAGNGTFLHKDNGLMHTVIPVEAVAPLEDYTPTDTSIGHNLAKIDASLCYKVKTFFAKVVAKYNAESCVVLFYNADTEDYALVVPQQAVAHGGVKYHRGGLTHMQELAGYVPVGTIHSHCDFQAFHSGTDDRDEEDWDGLHITFGHNDQEEFTISASIVMNAKRGKFDPMTIIEGIAHIVDDRYTLVEQGEDFKQQVEQETDLWMQQIVSWSEIDQVEAQDETENEEG